MLKSDVDQHNYLADIKFELKNEFGSVTGTTAGSDGSLVFNLLDNDLGATLNEIYELQEVTAPIGYIPLDEVIELTVDKTTKAITTEKKVSWLNYYN